MYTIGRIVRIVGLGLFAFVLLFGCAGAVTWGLTQVNLGGNTGPLAQETIDLDSPEALARTGTDRQAANEIALAEMPGDDGKAVELRCDEAAMPSLKDPNTVPAALLQPGEFAVLSMDPGTVTWLEQTFESTGKGAILALYNGSTSASTVTVATGWNAPNGRHNVHLCVFRGTPEQAAQIAADWQGPLGGPGEGKDVYHSFALMPEGANTRDFAVVAEGPTGFSFIETTVPQQ